MKLSLNQLKVEHYASQISETELVAVKGGTPLVTFNINITVQNVNQNTSGGGSNHASPTVIIPLAPPPIKPMNAQAIITGIPDL